MKISLAPIIDGVQQQPITVDRFPFVFGRNRDSNQRLLHAMASRHHAQLTEKDGVVVIEDLDSTNGTYVNGQRVKEKELNDGDQIRLINELYTVSFEAQQSIKEEQQQQTLPPET